MKQQSLKLADLEFPDKARQNRSMVPETVSAMRASQGDRALAAKRLGISVQTLSKRLQVIRAQRAALESPK